MAMLDRIQQDGSRRGILYSGWILLTGVLFVSPLGRLTHLSFSDSDSSYLILIPFFAACLLYIERRSIFHRLSINLDFSSLLVFLGIGLVVAVRLAGTTITSDLKLAGYIIALLLTWAGGFGYCFGIDALRAAYFPLLFLFLMVPPPNFLLHRVIYLLQLGSAAVTGGLFDLFGVPVLRERFVFHLAQVNIEIANECSGIHSSIALLILALPVAHFGLRRFWKKAAFLFCALLMMVLKNGIRIVTLTLLAIYVNPGFLYGRLHREGGIVFFLLGLLLLLPVYLLLEDSPAIRISNGKANKFDKLRTGNTAEDPGE